MKKDNSTELTGVKEIARRANVAIATVDRVLHNRKGVSKQTREKILKIIDELNYQPNLLAKRLASGKTLRLATLIPTGSTESSFWQAPLKGIEQADAEINQLGIIIEKYFYDENYKDTFVAQTQKILATNPDGVLLAPSFIEESVSFVNACSKQNIPYVLIDSDLPVNNSLSYIGPELYRTGYLGGHLISYLIKDHDKVLLVNISKEIDNEHHLLKKEKGVRAYFKDKKKGYHLHKLDIKQTAYVHIKKILDEKFRKHPDIKLVFVTNARVSNVARYVAEFGKDVFLIGYDFLEENVEYMNKGVIDFLICQKPTEQAYKGIMSLYQYLAFAVQPKKVTFMPIDIITKENYDFYTN